MNEKQMQETKSRVNEVRGKLNTISPAPVPHTELRSMHREFVETSDALLAEIERLQAENRRLKPYKPEGEERERRIERADDWYWRLDKEYVKLREQFKSMSHDERAAFLVGVDFSRTANQRVNQLRQKRGWFQIPSIEGHELNSTYSALSYIHSRLTEREAASAG